MKLMPVLISATVNVDVESEPVQKSLIALGWRAPWMLPPISSETHRLAHETLELTRQIQDLKSNLIALGWTPPAVSKPPEALNEGKAPEGVMCRDCAKPINDGADLILRDNRFPYHRLCYARQEQRTMSPANGPSSPPTPSEPTNPTQDPSKDQKAPQEPIRFGPPLCPKCKNYHNHLGECWAKYPRCVGCGQLVVNCRCKDVRELKPLDKILLMEVARDVEQWCLRRSPNKDWAEAQATFIREWKP